MRLPIYKTTFKKWKELKMPRKVPLSDISQMFALLSQNNPNPQTELTFQNPYTLLVAVVLSAQATDVGVNKETKMLLTEAGSPEAMLHWVLSRSAIT
tara:strand:- start:247 stop:537 length:291 start_codon:yes stop_codon:yes gene_type:complete